MEFLPDDGHIHQYLDGVCTWCGAPPADNPPAEGAREAGVKVTEKVLSTDGKVELGPNEAIRMDANGMHFAPMPEGTPGSHAQFMVAVLTDGDIRRYATEAARVLKWAKSLEIVDNASAKLVAGDLRSIANLRRDFAKRKTEILAPLKGALKLMQADIATVEAPIEEADKIGRQKVTDWDAKQRQIKADAELATRKIAEAAELVRKVTDAGGKAPDLTVETVDIPADRGPIRPDSGGTVSMVDHWSAEVTDKHSIPTMYMEPNMQMLNLVARQQKGNNPLPGVKWVNNPTPSVR